MDYKVIKRKAQKKRQKESGMLVRDLNCGVLFSVGLMFQRDFDNGRISDDLRQEFENNENPLSQNVTVLIKKAGSRWLIVDKGNNQTYSVMKERELLDIHDYGLPGGSLNATVIEIESKGKRRSHPGEELLFCLDGKIDITVSQTTLTLEEGDAIFFWGTEPHLYCNADEEKEKSVALSVWVDPAFNIKDLYYHE